MVLPSSSSKRKEPPESSTSNAARPYSKTAAKEDRRKRGEIACAECRRLKVRCDRQIPCSTCVSRGCMALCPNGVLPPGDNSRFVEKSKEHLERKILKMEERMRALEDALAIAQAAETTQRHPLLLTPWRADDDEGDQYEDKLHVEEIKHEDPVDDGLAHSFGTLHVNENQRTMQFFGPSGGAESLLVDEGESQKAEIPALHVDPSPTDLRALGLPVELDAFFHAFPLAPPIGVSRTHVRATIESCLPSWERAESLCRIFLHHMSWMFQIATYQQLTEDLLPSFYGQAVRSDTAGAEDGPHDLALLLIVFAVGALVDLSLPAYNVEAQRYHALSRAALALQPLMDKASLATVKALHLISIYNGMSGKESNLANTYTVLNLAGRIAQRLGLHVDPGNWKLSEKEIYDRRCYFRNLLAGDMIQCLGTGRPPALAGVPHSVKIPTEEEEEEYQKKELAVIGFGVWGFRVHEACMVPVIRVVMAAKPPSYQAVLDLDKKIRAFDTSRPEDPPDSPIIAVSMRRWVRSQFLEIILMALHRGFFAQALVANPTNPLNSPYKHSFIMAYKCACRILETTAEQFGRQPQLLSRIWMIWSLGFASALVVGAVAIKCKDLALDPPPLEQFELAVELFQQASQTNSRAAAALPVLLAMQDQVLNPASSHQTMTQRRDSNIAIPPTSRMAEPAAASMTEPITAYIPVTQALPIGPNTATAVYAPSYASSNPDVSSQSAYEWQPVQGQAAAYPQYYLDNTVQNRAPSMPHNVIQPPLPPQWVPVPQPYATPLEGPPVDFIVGDSWSSFMEYYGGLGH